MKTNDQATSGAHIAFNDGTLYVSLSCDLCHQTVPKLREEVDLQISKCKPSCVVLDFSQVDSMDAGGLGLILGRAELHKELRGKLIIENPNDSVSRLLSIAGIKKVKNIKVIKK